MTQNINEQQLISKENQLKDRKLDSWLDDEDMEEEASRAASLYWRPKVFLRFHW